MDNALIFNADPFVDLTYMNNINWQKKAFTVLYLVFIMTSRSLSQSIGAAGAGDSVGLRQTADSFISALSMLDWDHFTAFFDDSATAFFPPSAKFAGRANNKTEIESIFKRFFDKVRNEKSHGPYLTIIPKSLKIQLFGTIGIVTFELEVPSTFGRRTLVLAKRNNSWVVVHLHASGIVTSE